MMRGSRRHRLAGAIVIVGALLVTVLPAGPALPLPSGVGLELRITALSPAIGDRGNELEVTGTVTNPTEDPIRAPTVTLRGSTTGLTRRSDVAAWGAGSTVPVAMTQWDEDRLAGTIAPGESRSFTLDWHLPDQPLGYAALPLAIEAAGARVTTFLPVAGPGSYAPLDGVVLLPLTLRPHRALFGDYGGARLAAWIAEIGPEGRLTRLLAAGDGRAVAWAIDPTLLAAPEEIPDERPLEPPAAGNAWDRISAQQKSETAARRAFRAALVAAVQGAECFVLPMADADLVAGLTIATTKPRLTELVRQGIATASASVPDCATRLLWPADGLLSSARVGELAAYLPGGRPEAVLGRAASTPGGSMAPTASWRTASGTPALAYDDALSAALLGLASDPAGVVTGQRLLADSLALFLQSPATNRRLLIVGPRGLTFNGSSLPAALDRLERAPWLSTTSLAELRQAARSGPTLADATPRAVVEPENLPVDPVLGAPPAITATRLRSLEHALSQVTTTAKVRADGTEQVQLWDTALDQLLSARWRGDNSQFQGQMQRLRTAGTTAGTAVYVTPETINFFADSGRLQLTVTNTLGVGLTDLHVDLTPLSGWLRLDGEPRAIDVGAHSKAVVTVHATALAAGRVPIRARLAARDGSAVGPDTTVLVRVRPTGDWIYWAMGGVAAVLVLLGARRNRSRPHRHRLVR